MRTLKKFTCGIALAIFAAAQVQAQLIDEKFSYVNGDLVTVSGGPSGAGSWSNFSGTVAISVVNSQAVVSGTASMDDQRLVGGTHSNDVLWASFDLNMSVAPIGVGTYFIHFKNNATFFDPRVWAVSDGASGFQLGIANGGNGSAVGSPLTASLSLGTTYRVAFEIDQTGANLFSKLWVTSSPPINIFTTSSVTATDVLASGTALVAIALRQGAGVSGGVEGTQTIDNLLVDTTAAGVGLVPEPSTMVLAGAGLLGLLALRRRRS